MPLRRAGAGGHRRNAEILQLALLNDTPAVIPPEAICVHTRQGQQQGPP